MATDQVEFTAEELLATHELAEPLVAGGQRCHGGFDAEGRYVSPRTLHRAPAIAAWEAQRSEQFGTPALDIGLESWPEQFPNVAQTKFLLRNGVRQPTISTLTRIGTVEGFGGMLRLLPIPDWEATFDEDVRGTAIDHVGRGLFEAHARDEAGHETEAGHDHMWFAARDIAFDAPITDDQRQVMLERMGLADVGTPQPLPPRLLPDDVDHLVELVVARMINLLFIEISAFHGFAWAETVLGDTDLVAGDGEAARLISHIRSDETPHVAYLRTALSEMRDRTWTGAGGRTYDGSEMIGRLWQAGLEASSGARRQDFLRMMMGELELAVADRPDGDDLIEELLSLGRVRRLGDGRLVDATDQRTPTP